MGIITDILRLGDTEAALIRSRYPTCVLKQMSKGNYGFHQYKLLLQDNSPDDDYYYFLLANLLAVSSRNFTVMMDNDQNFTERMRNKTEELSHTHKRKHRP